jgi:hypothetical protein
MTDYLNVTYPSATTYLSTELNSLADGGNDLGAAIGSYTSHINGH